LRRSIDRLLANQVAAARHDLRLAAAIMAAAKSEPAFRSP